MSTVDFGIEDRPCIFCGQEKTVGFEEHWSFCPGCSTIYTILWGESADCEHFKRDENGFIEVPAVRYRGRVPGVKINKVGCIVNQTCSICGAKCEADGW